jgi:hypothetical protein
MKKIALLPTIVISIFGTLFSVLKEFFHGDLRYFVWLVIVLLVISFVIVVLSTAASIAPFIYPIF